MHATTLDLPRHDAKPRSAGLTMMIDPGLPTRLFVDTVTSFASYIDVVKFGWGTSIVTDDLKYKIDSLRDCSVDYYFGGTLFERFVLDGQFDDWRRYCDRFGCRYVEISNGTIPLTNEDKAGYIARVANDYVVFSEVGFKDAEKSENLRPGMWIRYIQQDLAAGAAEVITEARESGRSGICRADGKLRFGLVEEIAESGIDLGRVMFEAPNKELQTYFIRRFGPQVNLGNIAAADVVGLETLRLGLRGDTLLDFADGTVPDA